MAVRGMYDDMDDIVSQCVTKWERYVFITKTLSSISMTIIPASDRATKSTPQLTIPGLLLMQSPSVPCHIGRFSQLYRIPSFAISNISFSVNSFYEVGQVNTVVRMHHIIFHSLNSIRSFKQWPTFWSRADVGLNVLD